MGTCSNCYKNIVEEAARWQCTCIQCRHEIMRRVIEKHVVPALRSGRRPPNVRSMVRRIIPKPFSGAKTLDCTMAGKEDEGARSVQIFREWGGETS